MGSHLGKIFFKLKSIFSLNQLYGVIGLDDILFDMRLSKIYIIQLIFGIWCMAMFKKLYARCDYLF